MSASNQNIIDRNGNRGLQETPQYAGLVYFNGTNPNSSTVFDDVNPPVANDPALQSNDDYLFVGTDGKTWIYNASTGQYTAYNTPANTEWYYQNTTTDAGGDKVNSIWRQGRQMGIGGFALSDSNVTLYQDSITKGLTLTGTPIQSFGSQGNGARWILGINIPDNVQHWFGDYNGITNNAIKTGYEFARFIHVKNECTVIDAIGFGNVSANIHVGQKFVGIGGVRLVDWSGQPLYNGHIRGTFGVDTLPTYNTATDILVKNPTTQQIGVRSLSSLVPATTNTLAINSSGVVTSTVNGVPATATLPVYQASYTATQTAGAAIGNLSINGASTTLYAPQSVVAAGTNTTVSSSTVSGVTTYTVNSTASPTTVTVTPAADAAAPNSSKSIGTVSVNGAATTLKETVTSLFVDAGLTGPTIATYYNEDNNPTVIPGLNVLTTAQPTPSATGNTTNRNSVFKDAAGDTWVVDAGGDAVKAGSSVSMTTTSITPESGNGTTYATAKVTNSNTVADVLKLSNGSHAFIGDKITWTAHGLPLHSYAFLTDTAPGYTFTEPTTGLVQRLFYVYDANTIEAVLEPASQAASSSGGSGVFANTVYFNGTDPSSATIFDLANPPVTNDNTLKADAGNVYVGTNNQMWTYNSSTSTYSTYNPSKVVFKGRYSSPVTIGTGGTIVSFTQIQINNTPTAWNNSTGTFTAPSAGVYMAAASFAAYGPTVPASSYLEVFVIVNGAHQNSFLDQTQATAATYMIASGAVPVYLNAGDTLKFNWSTNVNGLSTHVAATYVSITQL